ncbi:acetate--CoA ligase family protein [Alphaproteobacteria bacterium LSUCC0684]
MGSTNPPLAPLLAPSSVALLGASLKPDSYGYVLYDMLKSGGYEGAVYPVNPGYVGKSDDAAFYGSMADLPAAPDHTVIAVATERAEAALEAAIRAGTRAATVFADTRDRAMKERIGDMAREAGIPLVGPNSMGLHNLDLKLRITPFPMPLDLKPGGIAAIIQSGSVLGALVNNDRRLRFNTVISTGAEAVTTAADYLKWVIDLPGTRVAGLFLEAVRDPDGFIDALEEAGRRDIPVVILKVGRSAASARMALSHTGAIVGNHEVFRAAVESRGAHLVETLDEMAATLAVFSQGRRAAGDGIATIHDSGGERELIADLAEDLGVPFARLSPQTRAEIQACLEPGMEADNPMDAWGTGYGADMIFTTSFKAMLADKAVAAGLYMMDWRQEYYLHEMHEKVLCSLAHTTTKPVIAASNYALTNNRDMASRMADLNIPLVEGTREALIAVRHLLHHGRGCYPPPDMPEHPNASAWKKKISASPPGEDAALALLRDYGITTPETGIASSSDEAVAAAMRMGFPVVLKTLADGVHHKTEVGGVKIGLETSDAVADAYHDLAGRLSEKVLVARMIRGEAEMALGAVNDTDFGMAVMISAGGTGVELLDDKLILMAPFSAEEVLEKLPSLKIYRLLEGYRGRPRLNIEDFAEMAARFSHLAHDMRAYIASADINPVIISEDRACAVDALIIPD